MLTRRLMLAALACVALVAPAHAGDWKSKYKELTFGLAPTENATDAMNRWGPFAAYLSKQLGVKVKMRITQDYAAVIEGLRAGSVQIANLGAAGYARAHITGVNADIFATTEGADHSTGYYSVFFVLAKSPYHNMAGLKGKNLGLVDPNSTSGNNVPRFELNKLHINPEKYFGKVVYTGSHENAILALSQGTVDVVANAWANDSDSVLQQMLTKGILKHDDGTPFKKDEFRIILKSNIIPNGTYVVLGSLPADLKAAIAKAFFDAAKNDKAAVDRLYDGKQIGFVPKSNADYADSVKLVQFVDKLRKKNR